MTSNVGLIIVCVEIRQSEAQVALDAGTNMLVAKGAESGGLVGEDATLFSCNNSERTP